MTTPQATNPDPAPERGSTTIERFAEQFLTAVERQDAAQMEQLAEDAPGNLVPRLAVHWPTETPSKLDEGEQEAKNIRWDGEHAPPYAYCDPMGLVVTVGTRPPVRIAMWILQALELDDAYRERLAAPLVNHADRLDQMVAQWMAEGRTEEVKAITRYLAKRPTRHATPNVTRIRFGLGVYTGYDHRTGRFADQPEGRSPDTMIDTIHSALEIAPSAGLASLVARAETDTETLEPWKGVTAPLWVADDETATSSPEDDYGAALEEANRETLNSLIAGARDTLAARRKNGRVKSMTEIETEICHSIVQGRGLETIRRAEKEATPWQVSTIRYEAYGSGPVHANSRDIEVTLTPRGTDVPFTRILIPLDTALRRGSGEYAAAGLPVTVQSLIDRLDRDGEAESLRYIAETLVKNGWHDPEKGYAGADFQRHEELARDVMTRHADATRTQESDTADGDPERGRTTDEVTKAIIDENDGLATVIESVRRIRRTMTGDDSEGGIVDCALILCDDIDHWVEVTRSARTAQ